MINKLVRIIIEGEGKRERERERERERVYQTAVGGRTQGGMDPVAEEERGPDGGSRARR
jgi:hypothetical protein